MIFDNSSMSRCRYITSRTECKKIICIPFQNNIDLIQNDYHEKW